MKIDVICRETEKNKSEKTKTNISHISHFVFYLKKSLTFK